jgi:hypothetical protein
MADEPENIVLVYLRRLDSKMDRVLDDLRDLKVRTTAAEEAIVGAQPPHGLDRRKVGPDRKAARSR